MKRAIVLGLTIGMLAVTLVAQSGKTPDPVFPVEAPGLIYIEGEDAVSTNFAPEANLDYASSGQRMLQLNQGPQAPGAPFFAEYAFYADQTADYELWLGGTPPGTQDALLPSYASPFKYILDGGTPLSVYRENVNVVETYTVTNYWSVLKGPIHLTKGPHVLRFEISEKRRFDSRYYFYLDALFLLKSGTGSLPAETLPALFPKDRTNRSIDHYYNSITQYEAKIQNAPKDINGYLELARVYSLVADYTDALKILSRAQTNAGDDPRITLLQAKNQIWSGEFAEGLRLYRIYLKTNPDNESVWAESAKVIAWLGQYNDSLALYREGLKNFPDDLNLLVNQGLTMLWANRVKEGEAILGEAWNRAKSDPAIIKTLGTIYWVNGYPDKTIDTYRKGTAAWPDNLELLLLLEEAILKQGQPDAAKEVKARILKTFALSDRLNSYLDTFELKNTLKQTVLDGYAKRLEANPDDLTLREELARAYFWNGRKNEAILETRNILVNRLYRQFQDLDHDLLDSYRLLDGAAINRAFLSSAIPEARQHQSSLQSAFDTWKKAFALELGLSNPKADATKLPIAKESAAVAENALAIELLKAQQQLDLFGQVTDSVDALQTAADIELAAGETDKNALAKRKPWTWDRNFLLLELNQASARKVPLADYLLVRLGLLEGRPVAASLAKLPQDGNSPREFRVLANQATLWQGKPIESAALSGGDYFAYGGNLTKLAALRPRQDVAETHFNDDTPLKVQDVLKELAALPARAQARLINLAKLDDGLRQHALWRMQVQYYQYEADSFGLRYQLGDYYLNLNQYQDARIQLEHALLVEPWNINARFALGRASQMSGDWSGAMKLYQEVFKSDPRFENTASLYNQLAKIHADRINSSIASFWDSNRTTTSSRLEYEAGGSSIIGFKAGYTLDMLRLIKPVVLVSQPIPKSNLPVTINLNTFDFTLPLTFSDIGLTAFIKAGGVFKDKFFSIDDYALSHVIVPTDLSDNIVVAPLVSAGLGWAIGPLSLNGSYTFDQLTDTLFPEREISYEHLGELTANLYFALPSPSFLRSIGSRSYGKLVSVYQPFGQEENTMYSLVEDLTFNLQISEAPWTVLAVLGTISWEDSTIGAKETNYYSPGQVFVGKGGLRISSWIGLGDDWVLGLSGRVGGGVNDTRNVILSLGEAAARIELTKGNLTMFVDCNGSFTKDLSKPEYWSLNALIGVNIAVPNYLVP